MHQDLLKGWAPRRGLQTRSWPGPLAASIRQGPDGCSGLSQAPDFYVEMKWEFTSWGEWGTARLPGDWGDTFGKEPW